SDASVTALPLLFRCSLDEVRPRKGHGIATYLYPHALLWQRFTCPARVVGIMHIGLRMRHQAKNPSTGITHCCNIIYRAIGIPGIRRRGPLWTAVACGNLPIGLQRLQHCSIARYKFPLTMAHG